MINVCNILHYVHKCALDLLVFFAKTILNKGRNKIKGKMNGIFKIIYINLFKG